jgi:hypothetical protein
VWNAVDIDYRYLKRMTDEGGMFQFARLDEPDPGSGYTVDDNARALLAALNMEDEGRAELARIYARFLESAQRDDGSWCNWKLDGFFVTDIDSADSQGRAFLACSAASLCDLDDVRELGVAMATRALPVVARPASPRAAAYALLGICLNPGLCSRRSGALAGAARNLAGYLVQLYDDSRSPGWQWFEDNVTYCNGIMPHALFAYYSFSQDRPALRVARDTLGWLTGALVDGGCLSIVGNRGWWQKGGEVPCYDQQPVDACSMVHAYVQAWRSTGDSQYLSLAELAQAWYWGRNINRISLYDANSGGCYDALVPDGVNLNRGAESVLSLLLSQQAVKEAISSAQEPAAGRPGVLEAPSS